MNIEQMLRDQERDVAALNAGVAAMETKIAGLDNQLRPDALRARTAEIRAEAGKALGPLVIAIGERDKSAADLARLHTPESERRLARFHDDHAANATMQLAAFTRLSRTSTPDLVEHLEDAVGAKNLALAEAVRLEFETRKDRDSVNVRFAAAFAKVETPRASAARQTLGSIASLAGLGRERFNSAMSGRRNPIDRLSAARLATAA